MILFSAAWRVFFPAAALFAGLAIPAWVVLYGGQVEAMDDPLAWHMHEMLFGYLFAALAGFLLTAVPNWTGRAGLKGLPLAGLFAVWLAGRAGMFFAPESLGPWLSVAFLPVLGARIGTDIIASGNRRNLVVVVLVALLWLAEITQLFVASDRGTTAGFAVGFVLMALIGGRVTPAFSRNWLMQRGAGALPAPFGMIDKAALGLSVAMALAWVASGASALTGILAALAALALLLRLARWQAVRVAREPLLLAQHVAYLWLFIGAALLALAAFTDLASISQVRHALGAGAIGSMTIIVMLRAALGHSGRAIRGGGYDWALFALIHLGAALRVLAGWNGESDVMITAAGHIWALAMLMFVLRVLPIAITPRQNAGMPGAGMGAGQGAGMGAGRGRQRRHFEQGR